MLEPTHWQSFGWIAVAVFGLAGGINQVVRMVDRWRGHPPVEHLQINANELTRRVATLEHSASEAVERRRAMHDKIDRIKNEIREENKADFNQVYDRLNELSSSVARLHSDTEHQNRQLLHIDAKLDRLIERK